MKNDAYQDKIQWLFQQFPVFQKVGESAYKPTLENTERLINLFSIPIDSMKFVHVAGTNGKGSTCSILASLLTESDQRVGLFTSPHIKDFRERIRVDGVMIEKAEVITFIDQIQDTNLDFQPSFFEITWVLALSHFYHSKCDMIVVETGLGGRLDATNTISPLLSVITNIGLDHTAILGDTMTQIANEKAGIIKQNTPILIGESTAETRPIFQQKASACNAPITFIEEQTEESVMECNKRLAILAFQELLKDKKRDFSDELVDKAITNIHKNTGFYGRNQVFSKSPLIILDAAHNEMGIERFIQEIQRAYSDKNIVALYGASNDKELDKISALFPSTWRYLITTFSGQRSMKLEQFKANKNIQQLDVIYYENSQKAFSTLQKINTKTDIGIVFGSFFLLEEII